MIFFYVNNLFDVTIERETTCFLAHVMRRTIRTRVSRKQ